MSNVFPYQDMATHVLERVGGACVLVIVLDGERGTGFGMQSKDGTVDTGQLARVLRDVAETYEKATPKCAKCRGVGRLYAGSEDTVGHACRWCTP